MTSKLAKCRTCDREVAVKAKTCPHCGERKPTKKKGRLGKIILIGFGCLFVMQMIVGTFASKQQGPLRLHSSASSVSGNWGIERSTSAMDDSVTIITQTEALAPVDAWSLAHRMPLSCTSEKNLCWNKWRSKEQALRSRISQRFLRIPSCTCTKGTRRTCSFAAGNQEIRSRARPESNRHIFSNNQHHKLVR